MELTLSPVYSAWTRDRLRKFYLEEVVDMDVSTVYVGEVICQKRSVLSEGDLAEIIGVLKDAGKGVYLSTLGLITCNEELENTTRYMSLFDGIEVNSFGVLNIVIKDDSLSGKDLVIGPFMNIYNSAATDYLKKFDPARIVAPYEVPFETMREISGKSDITLEINSWGQLSTALSWRCYTARTFELDRETCARKCFEHPDGILLETLKKEDLYIINGIQVLSSKMHCIIEQTDMLREIRMPSLRITPSYDCTADVVRIFSSVINGKVDKKEAVEVLKKYSPHGLSNGWFMGRPGWEYVAA